MIDTPPAESGPISMTAASLPLGVDQATTPEKLASAGHTLGGLEQRRVPRLTLSSELFRVVKINNEPLIKTFSLADLSTGGLGLTLLSEEDQTLFRLGAKVVGHLSLAKQKFLVEATVKHVSGTRIGIHFERTEPVLQNALQNFLHPANLGADFKWIPIAEEGLSWYHGTLGTELLLRGSHESLIADWIFYAGESYVQWDEVEGFVTGRTLEAAGGETLEGVLRLRAIRLLPDPAVDPAKLEIAKTRLLRSNLPQGLTGQMSKQFAGFEPTRILTTPSSGGAPTEADSR